MKKNIRGFTLIELLVVISIIGILASVVLAGTNSGRNKAKDTRIVSAVQQIRIALHFGFTNPVYRDLFFANGGAATNNALGTRTSNGPSNANLTALEADITGQSSVLTYRVNTNTTTGNATTPNAVAYAVFGRLISDTTKYFCMDSTGKSSLATSTTLYASCN